MNMTPPTKPLESLRQRFCRNPACRTLFYVCPHCDRGQRYCSPKCRQEIRRQQLCEASRRYQCSKRGRLLHLRRQRKYRKKCSKGVVTHQGHLHTLSKKPGTFAYPPKCLICRRGSYWVNPFYDISARRRRIPGHVHTGEGSKKYVFS